MCLLITTVTLLLNLEIALSPRFQMYEVQTSCRLNLGPLSLGTVHGYQVGNYCFLIFQFCTALLSKITLSSLVYKQEKNKQTKKQVALLLLIWLSKRCGSCKANKSFPDNTQRVKHFLCLLKDVGFKTKE